MRRSFLRIATSSLGLSAVLIVGCGEGSNDFGQVSIKTVPARGRIVQADGKPLDGGIITLEPLLDGGSSNQATGKVQADGTFELNSGANAPGAVPGKYRVIVEGGPTKASRKTRKGQEPQVEVREGQDLEVKLP